MMMILDTSLPMNSIFFSECNKKWRLATRFLPAETQLEMLNSKYKR